MQGRRLPDYTDWSTERKPGEYAKLNDQGFWWAIAPNGDFGCFQSPNWQVEEHEDRTITVSPSLWFDYPKGWHGFLRRGIWQSC